MSSGPSPLVHEGNPDDLILTARSRMVSCYNPASLLNASQRIPAFGVARMNTTYQHDPTLARLLILDELFDLSLYRLCARFRRTLMPGTPWMSWW